MKKGLICVESGRVVRRCAKAGLGSGWLFSKNSRRLIRTNRQRKCLHIWGTKANQCFLRSNEKMWRSKTGTRLNRHKDPWSLHLEGTTQKTERKAPRRAVPSPVRTQDHGSKFNSCRLIHPLFLDIAMLHPSQELASTLQWFNSQLPQTLRGTLQLSYSHPLQTLTGTLQWLNASFTKQPLPFWSICLIILREEKKSY